MIIDLAEGERRYFTVKHGTPSPVTIQIWDGGRWKIWHSIKHVGHTARLYGPARYRFVAIAPGGDCCPDFTEVEIVEITPKITAITPGQKDIIHLPLLVDRYNTGDSTYDATLSRASTATFEDFEGNTIEVLSGELRFQNMRRVENRTSTDFSTWTASDSTATDQGSGVYRVETVDTIIGRFRDGNIPVSDNEDVNTSIEVKSNTAISQDFRIHSEATGSADYTATTEWKRFAYTFPSSGGSSNAGIVSATSLDALDLLVRLPQNELVTDQSNQAPSEFIDSDTDYGAGVNGVKYFPYENGNTVDANGVVTEARGDNISGDGALVEESQTNLVTESSDLTTHSAATSNVTVTDYRTLTLTGASSYFFYDTVYSTPTSAHTASFRILGGTATGVVNFRLRNNTATETADVQVDMDTATLPITIDVSYLFTAGAALQIMMDNRFGSATATSGTIIIGSADVVEAAYSTSHIPTSGASATRLADDLQVAWPSGLVNDFEIECDFVANDTVAYSTIFDVFNSVSDRIVAQRVGTADSLDVFFRIGGVLTLINAAVLFDGSAYNIRVVKSSFDGLSVYIDGILDSNNANTSPLANLNYVAHLGKAGDSALHLNGTIKNFKVTKL